MSVLNFRFWPVSMLTDFHRTRKPSVVTKYSAVGFRRCDYSVECRSRSSLTKRKVCFHFCGAHDEHCLPNIFQNWQWSSSSSSSNSRLDLFALHHRPSLSVKFLSFRSSDRINLLLFFDRLPILYFSTSNLTSPNTTTRLVCLLNEDQRFRYLLIISLFEWLRLRPSLPFNLHVLFFM